MFNLNLDVNSKAAFFSRLQTVTVRANLVSGTGSESVAVAKVFKELLSALDFLQTRQLKELDTKGSQLSIEDVRGRPVESFTDGTKLLNPINGNRQEELLFLKGQILVPAAEEVKSTDDEVTKLPFSARLNSEFLSFKAQTHIVHRVFPYAAEVIRSLPFSLLFGRTDWVIPLEVETARIGFERFRAQYFGSMLGLMPRIVERCYLSLNADSLELFFEIELPRGKRKEEALNNSFLKKLDEVLSNENICRSFLSELKDRLH